MNENTTPYCTVVRIEGGVVKPFVILLTLALQGCGFGKIVTAIEEVQTEVVCTSGLYKLQYTPEQICEKCKNIENREKYCE